jgi:hypothetical protein
MGDAHYRDGRRALSGWETRTIGMGDAHYRDGRRALSGWETRTKIRFSFIFKHLTCKSLTDNLL